MVRQVDFASTFLSGQVILKANVEACVRQQDENLTREKEMLETSTCPFVTNILEHFQIYGRFFFLTFLFCKEDEEYLRPLQPQLCTECYAYNQIFK